MASKIKDEHRKMLKGSAVAECNVTTGKTTLSQMAKGRKEQTNTKKDNQNKLFLQMEVSTAFAFLFLIGILKLFCILGANVTG